MEEKVIALVKSPARDSRIREGKGYSLSEIKASGKTISQLKELGIPIDHFRRSQHEENVATLKNLKIGETKKKEKKPFVMKEKKPKKKKTKKKKQAPKPAAKKADKKGPKKEKKSSKKEGLKPEKKDLGIKLTELAGLGPKTAEKMIELGIKDVEALCNEDPKELAMLVNGCSEERIASWIEEGKTLINK